MLPFERAFRVLNDMEMRGSVFYSLAQIRFYIYSEICLVTNFCPPTHCMLAINLLHDLFCKAADLSTLSNGHQEFNHQNKNKAEFKKD